MQKILPSIHILEIFMPVVGNEKFLVDEVVRPIVDIPFYKGMELGVLFEKGCRKDVRKIVEEHKYQLTTWLSPAINDLGFNLSSLDESLRKKSAQRAIDVMHLAFEMGTTHCGIPCGPYPGPEKEHDAMKALEESYLEMLDAIREYPEMDYTFEPLDRLANKKQLLGPMSEVVDLFKKLRKESEQIYIHWDMAHETLNGLDLNQSLEMAKPYLAQIHLCNCVNDSTHPYYGDWHMDVGPAPDYKNWGFLTPEICASVIKRISSFEKSKGIKNTFCSVEMRSHMANDLWAKEKLARGFLQRVFDLAGVTYER